MEKEKLNYIKFSLKKWKLTRLKNKFFLIIY
jgi:hypothetical protein